ncbi:MAG TPA: SRPBCC family protein [Flavobacteriales bacterium]|nr:SRPBCC family protein [Flavobacteriales bacterium]
MRLIQHHLPRPRHVEIHRIAVNAPPAEAWEAARHFEGATIPWVRFLFDLRTLPDRLRGLDVPLSKDSGLGVDDIASHGHGFMLLDERPGEEVVVGAVGQFWHMNIPFKDVPPDEFVRFAEPGWGKVAWCIRVEPRGTGSWVTLELRVTATDDTSWRKQTAYFRLIGPFSHLIRTSAMAHLEAQLGKAILPADDNRPLSGDEILPDAPFVLTHGIDIEAPPSLVWPWLMQLGCDRGGWYSIDSLDHGGVPSVSELRAEWTERGAGDTVHATPALDGGYTVRDVQREKCLVLGAETDRMGGLVRTSWSFVLEPIGPDATRLITRVRGTGTPPWSAWLQGAVLFPPVHALMQRAQLKNLKALAEEVAWERVMQHDDVAHV